MDEREGRSRVISELEAVLEAETGQQKNVHVRQALRLLTLDEAGRSGTESE
jgi:hypothetical protein